MVASANDDVEFSLTSPGDLLHLLPASSTLVVNIPDQVDPRPIAEGIAASLPQPRKSTVFSSLSRREETTVIALAGTKTVNDGLKAIRKAEGLQTVVLDLTGNLPGWADKQNHVEEFFSRATEFLRDHHTHIVWIIARRYLNAKQWAAVRDQAGIYLELTLAGPWLYAQVHSAKGVHDPSLFLPRAVRVSETGFSLGKPVLPPPGREGTDALQEVYRQAFANAGEGIVLFDPQGGFREANRRALEMLGRDQEDFRNAPLSTLIAPSSYRRALRMLVALRKKNRVAEECDLLRANGRTATVTATIVSPSAHLAVAVLRDAAAERKKIEEDRRAAEEAIALMRATPVPQAVFAGRKLVEANAAFRELFAKTLGENESPTLQQLFGKDNVAVARDVQKVGDENGPAEREVRDVEVASPDAAARRFDLHASRIAAGGRRGILLTLQEVTERSARIQELEHSVRTLRGLTDNEAAPATVARDNVILWANRGFADMLGYTTAEDVVGKGIDQFLAPRDRKNVPAKLAAEGVESGEVALFEYSALSSSGKAVRVEASTQSIDYEGKPAGLTFHRNVSGKLKSTEELRQRLDEANRLERILSASRHVLEPAAFAQSILEGSLKQFGFDAGAVYGIDQGGDSLSFLASSGFSEQATATLSVQPMQEGVSGFVAKTLEPLHLMTAEYPAHLPYKSLFETSGFTTAIYLPLVAGETFRGILLLCSIKPVHPTDFSASFLETVARAFGAGMDAAVRFHELSRSERLYRGVVEGDPDIAYRVAPSGAFLLLAPQVHAMLGYEPQEFQKNPELWRQCIHPDDRIVYSERIGNQGSGKDGGELTYRMLPKGKAAYRRVRDAFRYIKDADGTLQSVDGIVSDITERIAREQEERAALGGTTVDVLQSLQEGVVVLDRDLRVTAWNNAMQRLSLIRREEIEGQILSETSEHPILGVILSAARRALLGENVDLHDVTVQVQDRSQEFWVRCSPVDDPAGMMTGAVATLSEMTARKGLERELAASEATLRTVIDGMGDALIITDLQGRIGDVNREFTRITGYSRQEVQGLSLPYPWLAEEEMGNVVAWVSALREKQDLRDFDMTWLRKDGHRVAISLNTTLLKNAAGEPGAMLNIARNITERKALADELASKNRHIEMQIARIKALYELGEGFAGALDSERVLSLAALQAATSVGYDRFIYAASGTGERLWVSFAMDGSTKEMIAVSEDEENLVQRFAPALLQGSSVQESSPAVIAAPVRGEEKGHGALLLLRHGDTPYDEADLRLVESMATLTGIALDRAFLYEDTLAKSREIQARNRELDDFTYVVSHDLKEPLITIEGYSTIVEREFGQKLEPEALEYLRSVTHAADRMKRLIDDLLTLSRVGRSAAEVENVSIAEVLETVLSDLHYTLKERHARVTVTGEMPTVRYNPTQLGLIFRNLIANGIKFNKSDAPEVVIEARDEQSLIVMAVRDNGIGIEREYFDRIFGIFQRLHKAEEYPGTGAGLTIVKKIVERHRGQIWLESEVGKGTTVYFTIPKGGS